MERRVSRNLKTLDMIRRQNVYAFYMQWSLGHFGGNSRFMDVENLRLVPI